METTGATRPGMAIPTPRTGRPHAIAHKDVGSHRHRHGGHNRPPKWQQVGNFPDDECQRNQATSHIDRHNGVAAHAVPGGHPFAKAEGTNDIDRLFFHGSMR